MSDQFAPEIHQLAAQFGIPASLIGSVMRAESGGNPNARSPVGAIGLMQLMPGTARGLGVNPYDPSQNLKGGAKYLSNLYHQYGGDVNKTLAAYNAGPGAVNKYGGIPPYAETQAYVKRVRGYMGANAVSTPSQAAVVPTQGPPGLAPAARQWLANYLGQDDPILAKLVNGFGSPPPQPRVRGGVGPSMGAPVNLPTHGGVVNFMGKPVASWIAGELAWARAHGWRGAVTSGYRTPAEQAALIGHSGGNPVAAPGHSNHNFTAFPGGAVDVSNAAQLAKILAAKPGGSLLVWAGGKDPVHFSHPHNGGY